MNKENESHKRRLSPDKTAENDQATAHKRRTSQDRTSENSNSSKESAKQSLVGKDADDNDDDEADTVSYKDESKDHLHKDIRRKTKLYFFGRTDRDKECWFQRFVAATHKGAQCSYAQKLTAARSMNISNVLILGAQNQDNFEKILEFSQLKLPYEDIDLLPTSTARTVSLY